MPAAERDTVTGYPSRPPAKIHRQLVASDQQGRIPQAHMNICWPISCLLSLLLVTASTASEADKLADLSRAVTELFDRAERARTLVRQCSAISPAERAEIRHALAGWERRNDAAYYDALIAALKEAAPGLAEQMDIGAERLDEVVSEDIASSRNACTGLPERLASDEFSITTTLLRTRQIADEFGLHVEAPSPAAPAPPTHVVPLAQFSARAGAIMDEIGSKEGAESDSALRDAREAHLLARLQAEQSLMVYGRVVSRDELREWQGEAQSSFSATCTRFADAESEARMSARIGEQAVLGGRISFVSETPGGGMIGLTSCQILSLTETNMPLSQEGEVELVSRPPESDEVRAADGQDISPDQIVRLLYQA